MKSTGKLFRFRVRRQRKEDRAVYFFWAAVSAAIICGGAAVILQVFALIGGWEPTVHRERLEFDFTQYISVSSADIPLEVFTYNGDKIIVEYAGETALIVQQDALELTIRRDEAAAFSFFSGDMLNYRLQVFLPDMLYRDIKLSSSAGTITAGNVRATLFNVNSRTGAVNISVPESFEVRLSFITETGKMLSEFADSRSEDPAWYTVRTISGNLNIKKHELTE